MFILAGSALLGHSMRLNDLDRILKLLVKIIILSISISRYPLLNGENFKTSSLDTKRNKKISLNGNMMKLAKSATGRPWQNVCPPFWWQKKSRKKEKSAYTKPAFIVICWFMKNYDLRSLWKLILKAQSSLKKRNFYWSIGNGNSHQTSGHKGDRSLTRPLRSSSLGPFDVEDCWGCWTPP